MHKIIRGFWRFLQPIHNQSIWRSSLYKGYVHFLLDWIRFSKMKGEATFENIAPILKSANEPQTGGGHYFYQDIWALKKIKEINPIKHVDIGSRYDGFVGQCTVLCPVFAVDIRPVSFKLDNFTFVKGSITELPFNSNELFSISCLHTVEHIGLGRYGDPLDPMGFEKAMLELMRVLSANGHLLLSMPIGIERVEFNAQRIINPLKPIEILKGMQLKEFSVVDDNGDFMLDTNPMDYVNEKYSCGLYYFIKRNEPYL